MSQMCHNTIVWVSLQQLRFCFLFVNMPDAEVCNDLCSNSATFQEMLELIRKPQKPSKPVAECDDGIYVMVKWTQPEDDSGIDITGYVIKYGGVKLDDKDTYVYNYATLFVAGNTTSFQFTDQLKEWTRYQFAVAAANRVRQGEFSELSDYICTWGGKYCCD